MNQFITSGLDSKGSQLELSSAYILIQIYINANILIIKKLESFKYMSQLDYIINAIKVCNLIIQFLLIQSYIRDLSPGLILHLFVNLHYIIITQSGIIAKMFPKLFRIGPLAILQIVIFVAGAFFYFYTQIIPCYAYTLIELSFQLFLIQMYFALKMIRKNKKLRIKYIGDLIFGKKYIFVSTLVWNSIALWSIIITLLYWTIQDGITLTSFNYAAQQSKVCFSLYPLCLFSELAHHAQSSSDFTTITSFLYASTIFVNFVFIILVNKQFYHYYETLTKNRKMIKQLNLQKSQSLLDCRIINYSVNTDQKETNEDFVCAICLRKFCTQKIIQLKCQHFYHEECISIWLKVKDHCPYRCP